MLNPDDIEQMRADLASVRQDKPISIVIRRGATTLTAQNVRLARPGGHAQTQASDQARETRAVTLVFGVATLDIQVDDRFNDANGTLYRVRFVRPDRRVETVAEAVVVE
jgi:hypothetical protein